MDMKNFRKHKSLQNNNELIKSWKKAGAMHLPFSMSNEQRKRGNP